VAEVGDGRRRYDLFLSCSGDDREPVRRLVAALRRSRLEVFLDEDRISLFTGITPEIEQALRSSKALVAYYSASYASRPACQFELTAAFLAGQRDGDASRRIIVVNPEAGTGHLLPAELSDAKYAVLPATQNDLAPLASQIRARAGAVTGVFGDIAFLDRPRWFPGRILGAAGFIGRYREQWAVHSVLHASDVPLTQEPPCGPVAALVGMRGIGKTTLAAAYAWQFGAAFRGGVYWISLAGAGSTGADVLARYAVEVRAVAESAGLRPTGTSREQLFGLVGDHLATRAEPSLWVIDDVPADLDPAVIHRLVIPAGTRVRTLLITHRDSYRTVVPTVEVGPMTEHDARVLLGLHRQAGDATDAEALDRVTRQLGGHPYALSLAGQHLRHRHGLVSYTDYSARLATDPATLANVADLLRDAIATLDITQRLILHLALVCAPAALPAQLVDRVVAALPRPDSASWPDLTGAALAGLRDHLLATHADALWQFHPIVLDAAQRHTMAPVPAADIAHAAATATLALIATEGLEPTERSSLIRHAHALAGWADLPAHLTEALLRRLADHYESRGEPLLATGYREKILDHRPDAPPADLLAAAAAHHASGDHRAAVQRAAHGLERAKHDNDEGSAYYARRLYAETLDALGRFSEADPLWARLLDIPISIPNAEHVATRVAHIRSLRIRGRLRAAETHVRDLLSRHGGSRDTAVIDELQAARVELARIQLMSDAQPAARQTAALVLRHYQDQGLAQHVRSLEAREVLAEAQIAWHLWALWPEAELARGTDSVRQLYDDYRRTYGTHNTFTLTAAVAYAEGLVSQGKARQALTELASTITEVRARLGERHPLYLRATFLLGQAHARLGDYDKARTLYAATFARQLAVLGPEHPYTLRTQYELGLTLKMTGEPHRAAEMFRAVRRAAPGSVGRGTVLYAQANIATATVHLPTWPLRMIDKLTWRRTRRDDTQAR
jgi:tetratricopeptide (TPR) repeat protein